MSTTRRADPVPWPDPRPAADATDEDAGPTQALIDRHIVPGPGDRGPADARLGESGTPVWALVGAFFSHALADPRRVAAAYEVSEEAVRAALLFYRRHQLAIDGWLALNDA